MIDKYNKLVSDYSDRQSIKVIKKFLYSSFQPNPELLKDIAEDKEKIKVNITRSRLTWRTPMKGSKTCCGL